MPSPATLGRIVKEYGLDKDEVFDLLTKQDRVKFGAYLRKHVFKTDEVEAVPVETGTNA